MELADRVTGALLGLGVGDAMGGPLAFMSQEQIRIKHGVVTEMIGGGWLGLRAGETTDQTNMMLCVAESIVENGRFAQDDVARRYLDWLRSQPKDIDNITHAALMRIEEGISVEEASRLALELTGEDGATNGTLARSAPLAVLYHRDDPGLMQASLQEAAITHHDRRARSGAAIVNLFLSRLLRGVTGLDVLFDEVNATIRDNREGVLGFLPDVRTSSKGDLRPTRQVGDSLELALFHLYHGESFEDCVIRTINSGGPTDTMGAVAGVLAGAFHGPQSIPDRWLRVLHDRLVIERLAGRLHDLV